MTESELFNRCKSSSRSLNDLETFLRNYSTSDNAIKVREWYRGAVIKFLDDLSALEKCKLEREFKQRIDSLRKQQPDFEKYWTGILAEIVRSTKNAKEEYIMYLKGLLGKLSARDFVKEFDEDILTSDDYKKIGVSRDELEELKTIKVTPLQVNLDNLDKSKIDEYSLPNEATEIYFWGMPACGKTCCLGAVLSMLERNMKNYSSNFEYGYQGTSYFQRLGNLFMNDGSLNPLAAGTNETSIAFAKYTIGHPNLRKRQVCLIDLAGETFKAMHQRSCQEDLDEVRELCLDVTTNFLTNHRNRKLHFFLIPYSENNRFERNNGITMNDYLKDGITYLAAKKVISKSTDGIYIIVTKADLIGTSDEQMDVEAERYVKENFNSFYTGLNDICKENGIGSGSDRVQVIGFSIGDMVTKEVCRFRAHGAERLVNIICEKSYKKAGRWRTFFDKFLKF